LFWGEGCDRYERVFDDQPWASAGASSPRDRGRELLAARALAAELSRPLDLGEALGLLLVIGARESCSFPCAGARFVGRLALERPLVIAEVEHAAATVLHLPAPAAYADLGDIRERYRIRPPRATQSGRGSVAGAD
jgi:hypothetical protein